MDPFTLAKNVIDPYPFFNELRDTTPIHELEPGIWIVSKYEHVKSGLKDHKRFISKRKMELCESSQIRDECKSNLFTAVEDPPEYDSHREAIAAPFTKRSIDGLASTLDEQAAHLTGIIKNKADINFFDDFSYPYIGNTLNHLLGFSEFQTYKETKDWIQALERTTTIIREEDLPRTEELILKQKELFRTFINRKRESPTGDFISNLINNASTLSSDQLAGAIEMLYRGGYQTTVHSLSVMAIKLVNDKSMCETLEKSPSLIPAYVDEILRLYSPVPAVLRHTSEDVRIMGTTIPKGDAVWFSLAGANRDPSHFPSPNQIDLKRKRSSPVLSFGYGVHICLGLYLARLEAEIAIRHLLPVLKSATCSDLKDATWTGSLVFRGIANLTISNPI